ncbi:MAG TPA: DUF6531 domain-containing protein [Chloroflexia bacterium]
MSWTPGPGANLIPYDARWANLGWLPWLGFRGDPVNTGLGSFFTRHEDLRLPGRGMGVDITRAYNSLDNRVGMFGLAWRYTYDMTAIDRGDGSIIVTFADGRAGLYLPDGGGGYTTPDGFFAQLTRDGGQLILKEVDQTVYAFNTDGTLHTITDSNSNRLAFAYDGLSITLTDTVGRIIKMELNEDGFISKITYPEGRSVSYEYTDNRLTAFHDAEQGTIRYAYNGDGLLESITDPNNHTFVTNVYDALGKVVQQTDAEGSITTFAYQDSPRVTTVTDSEQHATVQEFDSEYRLVRETDALGNSLEYQYDIDNNRTYSKERGGAETFMEYDERGNLTRRIDALSQEATFQYDGHNNLVLEHNEADEETSYIYDARDNLTEVHDAEGGVTGMTYDQYGQRVTERNANLNLTEFGYDAQGNLISVVNPLGQTTSYTYDGAGRRRSMLDANSHTVGYSYDNNDRPVSITDPKNRASYFDYDAVGNLEQFTDRRGYITRYTYDRNGNLMKVVDPRTNVSTFTYDRTYHRTSATNGRGNTTHYHYNAVYDLEEVVDAKGNPTHFTYDADHNLVEVTDALQQVTAFDYDALDRLTNITDALNGRTEYEYDPVGRRTQLQDPKGGFTHFQYDRLGRLTDVVDALNNHTAYGHDAMGNQTSVTNARGVTTSSKYDAANRLVEQYDPLGVLQKLGYDGVGNVISATNANSYTTLYKYDENDNLAEVLDALNGRTSFTYDKEDHRLSVTDPNNHTQSLQYDEVGNLILSALPQGQVTKYGYDENNNLVAITNAKTNITRFSYDKLDLLHTSTSPLGFVTTDDYDALGRHVRTTDAENRATEYRYDPLNRLVDVVNALGGHTRYEYDPLGNLTAFVDANTSRTAYGVDLLGRVVSETNPLLNTWTYRYDGVGNQVRRVDAKTVATDYTYDARNRMTRTTYPSGPGVTFGYDGNGNIISVADSSGASAFSYDRLDRLEQVKRVSGILSGTMLAYKYDPASNRTRITYPDGKRVDYGYDANDWLDAVTDPMNGTTRYTQDAVGLVTLMQNPNGTWANYRYDADDRLTRLFNGKPEASSNLISSFDYTLDKVGNRVRSVEQLTRGQVITWDKRYTYDALYRLTESVFTPDYRPAQVLTSKFSYDAVGNRRSMTTNISDKPNTPALPGPVTTAYSYNAGNQMLTAGSTSFRYDANGNRTSMSGAQRAIDYAFDFENRLSGARTYDVKPNGARQYDSTLDYTYDGLGRRLERGVVDNGKRKTAQFLYDGLGFDHLAQYVDPGSPRTTYYYRDPQQVLSRHEIQGNGAGLQYFHHHDGLGNVSAWTNQSGHSVQEYTYAPYGRLLDNNGPDNASNRTDPHNNLTWSEKPWDKETELNYFGARDYDPSTGTWLTQDLYRGESTEPVTLHRYQYANNNPATMIDPYGFSACFPNQSVPNSSGYAASSQRVGTVRQSTQGGALYKSVNGGTRPYAGASTGNPPGASACASCMPLDWTDTMVKYLREGKVTWVPDELHFLEALPIFFPADFKIWELRGIESVLICDTMVPVSVPGNVYLGYNTVRTYPSWRERVDAGARKSGEVGEAVDRFLETGEWKLQDSPADVTGYNIGHVQSTSTKPTNRSTFCATWNNAFAPYACYSGR